MPKPKTAIPRKPRAHPPENETNREKFLRLAQHRMRNAIKAIRLIGNLSSSGYESTADDVVAMTDTLQSVIESSMGRFRKQGGVRPEDAFRLGTNDNARERASA